MERLTELPPGHTSQSCTSALSAVEDTLYVLGGKWRLKIIVALREMGVMRFNELQRAITGISPRMLSSELKNLELNGFVEKITDPDFPLAIQYELTEYSSSLDELLRSMVEWGRNHKDKIRGRL